MKKNKHLNLSLFLAALFIIVSCSELRYDASEEANNIEARQNLICF